MRSTVSSFTTSTETPTHVSAVVVKHLDTDATTTLDAEVVIMGVGVTPATDFLKGTGIEMRKDGGVYVDECLRVRINGENLGEEATKGTVYAIGDIAIYPDLMASFAPRRIEHWNVRVLWALRLGRS